jgi:hypothetical protein
MEWDYDDYEPYQNEDDCPEYEEWEDRQARIEAEADAWLEQQERLEEEDRWEKEYYQRLQDDYEEYIPIEDRFECPAHPWEHCAVEGLDYTSTPSITQDALGNLFSSELHAEFCGHLERKHAHSCGGPIDIIQDVVTKTSVDGVAFYDTLPIFGKVDPERAWGKFWHALNSLFGRDTRDEGVIGYVSDDIPTVCETIETHGTVVRSRAVFDWNFGQDRGNQAPVGYVITIHEDTDCEFLKKLNVDARESLAVLTHPKNRQDAQETHARVLEMVRGGIEQ